MTRRLAILGAILTLVVGQLGVPATVLAAVPIAVDDAGVVVQKNASATTINVLANDTFDPEATISAVTSPAHGAAAVAGNGLSVSYTPAPGYAGLDTFHYTLTDPDVADGDATATVSLRVNAPPVAVDDPAIPGCMSDAFGGSFPIREDFGQFVFGAECGPNANDSDSDGTIASWQVDSGPSHGTLQWLASIPGFFGYTSAPNFSTPQGDWVSDSFTYHMVDNNGAPSNQATYRFWIAPINDPPTVTAGPLIYSPEDTPYSEPWATNISPGPANESSQSVHFELLQTILFSGPPLLFSAAPAISPDGTLTFTPAPNSFGYVRLSFVAKDNGGLTKWDNNRGTGPDPNDTSEPVIVDITVTSVNDPPIANDDALTILEDDPVAYYKFVAGNDTDPDVGDSFSVTSATDGAKGTTTTFGPGSGSVAYLPNPDAFGSDSFTYTITDTHGGTATATVHVTITPAEDAPVAVDDAKTLLEDAGATSIDVLANDADVDGDTLSITGVTDGTLGTVAITGGGTGLAYTPKLNANGSDSFTYTIDDGNGGTSTATVHVTITPVNDAPTAVADAAVVVEDQSASAVDALANDTDVEGDGLTITAKTDGARGTVTITGGGTDVSYKPNANAFGSDSFTYTVDDGHGGTATASVSVTITPVNDPPNAVNDGVPTPYKVYLKGGARAIAVLANDSYVPDAPETIRIIAVTQGGHGTVTITGGGTGLTYTPTGTATGIDVFSYTISDGNGGTDTASVQVNVVRDTTPPTASIVSIQKSTIPGRSGLRVYVKWAISESGSGLKSQLFQRRTDSGSWITVSLGSLTTRSVSLALARGHTYTFRVRATDRVGNIGAFASRVIRI